MLADNPRVEQEGPPSIPSDRHRFLFLDALRGLAAVSVVLLHGRWWLGWDIFSHGYLAVDFFFALSGFVIAYAYEEKLVNYRISVFRFVIVRIIRLYPLRLLGVVLGCIVELSSNFIGHGHNLSIARYYSIPFSLLVLPCPAEFCKVPYLFDPPMWSITNEIAANIIFASFVCRFKTRSLVLLTAFSGALEIYCVSVNGTIDHIGGSFSPIWQIVARTTFPFCAGTLIQRLVRSNSTPLGNYWCIILIVLIIGDLALPAHFIPERIYDLISILLLFPFIIWFGSKVAVSRQLASLAGISAAISFPLYAFHFPALRLYASAVVKFSTSPVTLFWYFLIFVFTTCVVAYVLAEVDVRFRTWLGDVLGISRI